MTALPIASVTVLEDRASVVRRGKVAVRAGQQRIEIDRVAPVLADKTLTASCTGARVLDVRCERYVAPWREGPSEHPVAALREQRAELEAAHDAAVARSQAAAAQTEATGELISAAIRDLAIAAARGIAAAEGPATLAELDVLEGDTRARQIDAELASADLAAALARLDARIARADAEAGEDLARLVIDLIADQAGEVLLTASYVVPGAAWRPSHRVQLQRATGKLLPEASRTEESPILAARGPAIDRTSSRLEWQTAACVWQATGEDWTDVELQCSLERPSLGVAPPELVDDELRTRRKPEGMVVEAREHAQQEAGLGGGPSVVPGIDDGGLGLRLSAGKVTIRSGGAPHRVPLGGFTAPAQLSLVAIPLRSPWVHLRARLVNTGAAPLLAGPVDLVMASGYVGRSSIGFIAAGEKLYVGFGPDPDLRVHRTETVERDDAGLLGGWNVKTVRVAVRLSNLGGERREVAVTERIPISEVEQVDVQLGAPDAYVLEDQKSEEITQVTARALDERGLVTWSVELAPHGQRAVTLEYKVKSQRGVAGV